MTSDQSIGQAWRAVRDRFTAAGLDTSALDARLLAQRAFGLDAAGLLAEERALASPKAIDILEGFAVRRLGGEPVARILGVKEFFGLEFGLNAATLVPRPETELLVELALEALDGVESPMCLDLGTGTGCIPIALLSERADARCDAVDIAADALAMAKENAQRHDVAKRLQLLEGSWFAPIKDDARYDLIMSNPPYIESAVIAGLATEVRAHDPMQALDGGADGLAPYRVIAREALAHLKPGGRVIVEIGYDQADTVTAIFQSAGFGDVNVHHDLAGHPRVIFASG